MLKSVEGIYRNGQVELLGKPDTSGDADVIVTFLPARKPATPPVLTPQEHAELRAKLTAWEEDWNAPGMEVYDDL